MKDGDKIVYVSSPNRPPIRAVIISIPGLKDGSKTAPFMSVCPCCGGPMGIEFRQVGDTLRNQPRCPPCRNLSKNRLMKASVKKTKKAKKAKCESLKIEW